MIGARNGATIDARTTGEPPATASASASFGLQVDVGVRPDGWFEAFVDHQRLAFTAKPGTFPATSCDFSVDYLQFGGRYEPGEGRVRAFVGAAAGLTRYGASPGSVGKSLGLSGSLSGGMTAPLSRRVALRLELRGYATTGASELSVTCGPGCLVTYGANAWFQVGARVGLAIRL